MLGRLFVIPFQELGQSMTFQDGFIFNKAMNKHKQECAKGFGVLLSLIEEFETMDEDEWLVICSDLLKEATFLDPRSILNYGFLSFATAKVKFMVCVQ